MRMFFWWLEISSDLVSWSKISSNPLRIWMEFKASSKWMVLNGQLVWQRGTQVANMNKQPSHDQILCSISHQNLYILDSVRCQTRQLAMLSLAGSQNLCQTITVMLQVYIWFIYILAGVAGCWNKMATARIWWNRAHWNPDKIHLETRCHMLWQVAMKCNPGNTVRCCVTSHVMTLCDVTCYDTLWCHVLWHFVMSHVMTTWDFTCYDTLWCYATLWRHMLCHFMMSHVMSLCDVTCYGSLWCHMLWHFMMSHVMTLYDVNMVWRHMLYT